MHDQTLAAIVRSRIPLRYEEGADAATDRPAHVRAASGLARIGSEIALIQDDASFIALIDPESGRARPIPLPVGVDGIRQFHKARGNKLDKLDLEACVVFDSTLIAFGSGSLAKREVIVRVRLDGPDVRVTPLPAFYHGLRTQTRFSGSEMNIEAATIVGDQLRLFSRGNGRASQTSAAVNASCDVDLQHFMAYLDERESPPAPSNIITYELGEIDGVPLGITDALSIGETIIYSAAAESSPDVIEDGVVAGSAIGMIDVSGRVRWTAIAQPSGARFAGKVEGILMNENRLLAVIDMDDPDVPSELCTIELHGFRDESRTSSVQIGPSF